MKKALILSLIINIGLATYFIKNKLKKVSNNTLTEQQISYFNSKKELYESLPIDTNDVVFIGNSITEGFPVTEMYGPDYKNRGISGNKSQQVLDRMSGIVNSHPAKIFLMIGVNDIKAKYPLDTLLSNTIKIINCVQPGTKLYVQSVLPTSMIYARLNENIVRYNRMLKDYCDKNRITYIDLYSSFAARFDSLTYDGLHLNVKGYTLWKDIITPYLSVSGKP